MQPYHHLTSNIHNITYTTIRTNKKITYLNLPIGFDIETTSDYVQGNKVAYMYVWAVGIGGIVYYGRTWEQLVELFNTISVSLELNDSRRIIVYVHNLSYEFQFMRKYFIWQEIFAVDERKPIKALASGGIEFRCSYILSGFNLSNLARNLTSHSLRKMDGDLDYSLIRHHETPLTDEEMNYLKLDVQIVVAYITEQIAYYGDITKLPLTNTGRVRTFVRNHCYYTSTNHRKTSKGKYINYRKIMSDLTVDRDIYLMLKTAFMGGFTHANALYSNKVLKGVTSIDFNSSYPSVMVSEKFPMSRFKLHEGGLTINQLKELTILNCLVFKARFHNIRRKITQETYISESKCFQLVKPLIDNGRVLEAEILATTITEVDFEIMEQVYEWDRLEISNLYYSRKAYLPKSIVEAVLGLYQDKTVLKGVKGKEVEYMLSKGMLNSVYGMTVTDIAKDKHVYKGDSWGLEPVNIDEELEHYNQSKNRFLYYAWGVWITAYARRNLWTGIMAVGDDYVYSDTDSLKLLNYEKHLDYIEWFNKTIYEKASTVCRQYKLDTKLLSPSNQLGDVEVLGEWDYEGTYDRFKTLGAKRYIYQEGDKVEITVAGLGKQAGVSYLLDLAGGDYEEVFKLFSNNLYVPPERTGKMTHTYIDNELEFLSTDYLGNTVKVRTLSGVHLEPCEFTLNVTEQYLKLISELSKGYFYKGVKYV